MSEVASGDAASVRTILRDLLGVQPALAKGLGDAIDLGAKLVLFLGRQVRSLDALLGGLGADVGGPLAPVPVNIETGNAANDRQDEHHPKAADEARAAQLRRGGSALNVAAASGAPASRP